MTFPSIVLAPIDLKVEVMQKTVEDRRDQYADRHQQDHP